MKKIRKKMSTIYFIIALIILVVLSCWGLKLYFDYIDIKANEILEKTDAEFTTENITLQNNGLYIVDIKQDLIDNNIDDKIDKITYKIKNEKFYFELRIYKDIDSQEPTFEIEKIVDDRHEINAKMNLRNIEKIEYRTGNINDSTVLNLITNFDSQYFAITENNYYFLGEDIESISFLDNHFYYVSYNKNYRSLSEAKECTKEVKRSIDGFNEKETYYNYGKINFFKDYYQKLSSKKYTVKDYCESLINMEQQDEKN